MKSAISIKKFLTIIFCVSLFNSSAVFAQKRNTAGQKNVQTASNKQTAPKCSGGWSGVISYKKTLKDSLESDEPGIRKDKDRIKHKTSRNYDYNGRAIVDGKDPKNAVVKTKINFNDDDLNWGENRVWESCGSRDNGRWQIIESVDNRKTEAKATGSAESFNLQVNEMYGNYSFSLRFPDADGTYNREQHVKRSGFCQAKNNAPSDSSDNEATKIEGEVVQIEDEKFDPKSPDVLTGTKIWGGNGSDQVKTFVYQATWKFTRCPAQILVTDVKFEDMKFPEWNKWKEVSEYENTIDGNQIKIKATVLNMTNEPKFVDVKFFETYKGDKWDGAKPDAPLTDGTVSVRLDAGEEREVEVLWDSEGYAWYDDGGRPRNVQRIRAEAWEEDTRKDKMTKNLRVAPKPLIVVPGIWSNVNSFESWQNYLTESHSYGWKIYVADNLSGGKTVYDNADALLKFTRDAQIKSNAWHVELIAHSTGGLTARLLVHKQEILPDSRPTIKHLAMLGTPNNGLSCEEVFYHDGDALKYNPQTFKEMQRENIALFNQFVKDRKGTKFSALVGNAYPSLCPNEESSNDGFVSVESAKFGIEDFTLTKDTHKELTDSKIFWNFVKPHVVTGPHGTYPLAQRAQTP